MNTRRKQPTSPRSGHPCAVKGCAEPGDFKAPLSRNNPGQYQYLCLEHVRKFNEAWDYFNGWKQHEIETFMHSSVHGHRPTWSVHTLAGKGPPFTPEALEHALHRMMGEAVPPPRKKPETKQQRQRREALATLNLPEEADIRMIKKHYKLLVKKYHPDVNSSREAEDIFKRLTEAYVYLTKHAGSDHET